MPDGTVDLLAVFERSPLLVSRLAPLVDAKDSPEDIVRKAREIVRGFDERELVAMLDAHPRIGHDAGALSPLASREQGADRDPATLRELAALNDEYERGFGFRFVVFVNGRTRAEIVPVLRERLTHRREDELAQGVEEFLAISLDRLRRARSPGRRR